MAYTFGSDAPTSPASYKDHDLSMEILQASQEATVMTQIVDRDFVKSGQSKLQAVWEESALPADATVAEGDLLPESKPVITAKLIQPVVKGRKTEVTHHSRTRDPYDIIQISKANLIEQYSNEMERTVRAALATSPVKYRATNATTGAFTTNGTPAGAAGSELNIYHLLNLSRYARGTLNMKVHPLFGSLVGFVSEEAIFEIQRDTTYTELHQGQGLAALEPNVVGKVAGITLLRQPNPDVLDISAGSSSYSEAFIVGANAAKMALFDLPRFFVDMNENIATEFGLKCWVAWRADYGVGLYTDSANRGICRTIHVSST